MADKEVAPWDEEIAPWEQDSLFPSLAPSQATGVSYGDSGTNWGAVGQSALNELLLGNLLTNEQLEKLQRESPAEAGLGTALGFGGGLFLTPQAKILKGINALKNVGPKAKGLLRIGSEMAEGGARGFLSRPADETEGDFDLAQRGQQALLAAGLTGALSSIGAGTRASIGGKKGAREMALKSTGVAPKDLARVDVRAEDLGEALEKSGVTKGFLPPSKQTMYTRIAGKPKLDKAGRVMYDPIENIPLREAGLLSKTNEKIGEQIVALDKANAFIDPLEISNKVTSRLAPKLKTISGPDDLVEISKLNERLLQTLPSTPSEAYAFKVATQNKIYPTGDRSSNIEKLYNKELVKAINEQIDAAAQKVGGDSFRKSLQDSRRQYEALSLAMDSLDKARFSPTERLIGGQGLGVGLPSTVIGTSFLMNNPALMTLAPAMMVARDVARKPWGYGAKIAGSGPVQDAIFSRWAALAAQSLRPRPDNMTPMDQDIAPWEIGE